MSNGDLITQILSKEEKPGKAFFDQYYGGLLDGLKTREVTPLFDVLEFSAKNENNELITIEVATDFKNLDSTKAQNEYIKLNNFLEQVKNTKQKTGFFNNELYDKTWQIADQKSEEIKDYNFAELQDYVNNLIGTEIKNNDYIKNLNTKIKKSLVGFEERLITDLRAKYDVNDPEQLKLAENDFKIAMSQAYDDFIESDKEYISTINSIGSAVQSRYNKRLTSLKVAEAEEEFYPYDFVRNSDYLKGLYKTVFYESPQSKELFSALQNTSMRDNLQKEIEELKLKNPNEKVKVAGVFKLGEPEKTTVAGLVTVEQRIKDLEKQIVAYDSDIYKSFAKSMYYQNILSQLPKDEIINEDLQVDATLDELQGILGTQTFHMAAAMVSMGGYTFMIESARAFDDMLANTAAKKMYPGVDIEEAMKLFNNLSVDDQINARLDLIEKGEVNTDAAFRIGGVNAGVDLVSNVFVFSKGAKFAPKGFFRQIFNGLYKKALNNTKGISKDIAQGTLSEVITETFQEVNSAYGVANASKTFDGFSDFYDKNKRNFLEASSQAALLPGPMIVTGQTVTSIISEVNANIQTFVDDNATRTYINKAKVEINNSFDEKIKKAGSKQEVNILKDQRDDALTNLYNNEQLINNSKYKNLSGEQKSNVIKDLNLISKNSREISSIKKNIDKIKKEAVGGLNTEAISLEIKLNELNKSNADLFIKTTKEIMKSDKHNNGAFLSQWVNNQTEGLFADKSVMTFDKLEDALKFIKDSNLTFKTKDAKQAFKNLRDGKSNGINYDNAIAIIVKENIDKNIDKGSAFAGNTVHHEVLHFIFDQYSADQVSNFAENALSELLQSGDPNLNVITNLVAQKIKKYKQDQPNISKKLIAEEILTGISDGLRYIDAQNINVKNTSALVKVGNLISNIFGNNSSPNFDYNSIDPANVLEFLRSFNSFNGKTNKAVVVSKAPKIDTSSQEVVKQSVDTLGDSLNSLYTTDLEKIQEILDILPRLAFNIAEQPRPDNKAPFARIPGFDKKLFAENLINDPDRGALNLILNFNRKDGELLSKNDANYNDDFGGYLISFLKRRANDEKILAASIRQRDVDVSEARGITADEITDQEQRAIEESQEVQPALIDTLPIKNKVGEKPFEDILNSNSKKVLLLASNKIDQGKSKNKKGSDLVSEIKREASDLLQFDVITWMGRDGKLFQDFLLENKNNILRGLSTSYLSRNFPNAIQKSVGGKKIFNETGKTIYMNGKEIKPGKIMGFSPNYVNDWQGKKIDKEIAAVHGRTAQHQIMRRHPNVGARIKPDEWIKFFTKTTAKGTISPIQSKQEGLAYQLGGEMALETIQKDFRITDGEGNFTGPLRQQYSQKLSLINSINNDALLNELAKDIERGTVKQSLDFLNSLEAHQAEFYDKMQEFVDNLSSTGGSVRGAMNKTYSTTIFGNKKEKIINDLQTYFDKFKVVKELYEDANIKMNITLEEYITNNIEADAISGTMKKMLGISRSGMSFSDRKQLEDAREAVYKIAQVIGFEKMRRFGSFLYQPAQIGSTFFLPDENGNFYEDKEFFDLRRLKKGELVKETQSSRYGLFFSAADFNLNVLGSLTDNTVLYNEKTKKVSFADSSEITPTASQSVTRLNDFNLQEDIDSAKVNTDFLIELSEVMNTLLDNGEISKNDVGMITMNLLHGGMSSPLAAAARVAYTVDGVKSTAKHIYEHVIPRKIVAVYFLNSIIDLNNASDFKNILDQFVVAVIPRKQAEIIDKLYKSKMPRSWKIGKDVLMRYFNGDTIGEINLILKNISDNSIVKISQDFSNLPQSFRKNLRNDMTFSRAVAKGRSVVKQSKGITILDFDDTLATTNSLVRFTAPNGVTGTLNAEQYASNYQDLQEQGYTFDFSEFNKVVDGKIAPLFQKALKLQGKFGPQNMFVLTARPPQAAKAIFDFLKANGLNIPLKNITGLANSTSEAKALWVADKVGEGFNDFYFADDALQNVQAVKNILDQFDVKSKVQQARVKLSDELDLEFNKILEQVTGIEAQKRFSDIKARKRGASKGKFRIFIPPSHEDFVGLIYNFLGKGAQGNKHRDFFEKTLIKPLNRAFREYENAKQAVANDYKSLNKKFPEVRRRLGKKVFDGDFTVEDAIRVYLYDKHGHTIPGLSKTDQRKLSDLVKNDSSLFAYAEALNIISRRDDYVAPTDGWDAMNIKMDLIDATDRVGRAEFFKEFLDNAAIIFSEENLNKIEAAYGSDFKSALKDMLHRIETGRSRVRGKNRLVNSLEDYVNAAVGTVMFFNVRSALLQQMSLVNFINYADNNMFAAAKAFADQKQYWEDWAFLFNSDFLKLRRGGIRTDVNGAELAREVSNSKYPIRSLIRKLLQIGFKPTQIGDNIAIATGGALFYRNRTNKYIKDGLSKKEAESRAFDDTREIAEATQQSTRPDMLSQQQVSPIGKWILAFQNVTSQMNRLGKKAFLDIKNRRITPPNTTQLQSDISNASRILYYFGIQNMVFYALQTALFAVMFDDVEEDDRLLKKRERMLNGSIDSVLRGSGLIGAAISTLKNMGIKFAEQRQATGYSKDESAVILELANLSPPLGIKLRKIVNAEKTINYNENVISEMEVFDNDNPHWSAVTNYIEALTNLPANRLYNKSQNMRQALNNQNAAYQRALMFLGWSQYNLGIRNENVDEVRNKIKNRKGLSKPKKGLGTKKGL